MADARANRARKRRARRKLEAGRWRAKGDRRWQRLAAEACRELESYLLARPLDGSQIIHYGGRHD